MNYIERIKAETATIIDGIPALLTDRELTARAVKTMCGAAAALADKCQELLAELKEATELMELAMGLGAQGRTDLPFARLDTTRLRARVLIERTEAGE